MSKYRKQDIETLLRLQLGEAEKAKINAQQAVERLECDLETQRTATYQAVKREHAARKQATQLRESRQCAETYMLIIADKLQFSSSQFSKLSSGWCEELVNAIAGLQTQLAASEETTARFQELWRAACDQRELLEQQVAKLRENVSKIECELSEWKLASAANETGHLFRCARVNGKWSCAKGCHAAAHTTLQGLVEQANYELAALFPVPDRPTFENAFTVCGNKNTADARCILNAYEAIHEAATLPREGATSDGGEHE